MTRKVFAYQAVYRYLEALIDEAGRGGQVRLPSLRALARRLHVSLATVQAAYGLLEHEGRVQSVPRSGYFARPDGVVVGSQVPHADPVACARPGLERTLLAHERRLARLRPLPEPPAGAGLRQALAERYTRSSRQCWRPEQVHLGPDLQALLETLLAALALRGSTVLVASPCCWRLLRILRCAGLQVREVALQAQGGFDLARLATQLADPLVRLVIVPSCLGNPSGSLMARQEQQQLACLLAEHPVWLLENDLDSELCFSTPRCARLRDWADPQRLLVLGSLEVSVGAEAPYAYVLSEHAALADAFAERGFQLPPLRQQALARMFAKGEIDGHLGRLRVELQGRMELLCQQVRACLGGQVAFTRPQGGRTLWLRLLEPMTPGQVMAELSDTDCCVLAGERFGVQGHYRQYLAVRTKAE
ncbi:aminotransferase class I/II-fold pyridoxal phosphate-dependent enzyme [Pseudomonas sp. NPDC089401]|uniref:aminotransferase class I/II-fold pyridoxal phosphate-dependent enzyme n=1 Tax=Pseudomonas sp. NPDC089401 TaxID=3364462 RepID=UPI0038196D18